MSNINLYQSSSDGQKKKLTLVDSGFFWSLSLLLVVAVSFVGLKFVSVSFEKKGKMLNERIVLESASFVGSDLNRIVDFQTRVDESVKDLASKREYDKIFAAVEGSMISGVHVSALSLKENRGGSPNISLDLIGNSYENVSRQILSFKENKFFTNVAVQDISRGEEGIILNMAAGIK